MIKQHQAFTQLKDALAERVLGQPELIERLLIAVLADGHVMLEGPPGLAKTRAAYLIANAFDGSFQRIQFTPDLLPADLTGTSIYDPREHRFDFHQGPLFSQFILADEINRAPAKVQAALLEAMEERQITAGGESRQMAYPFFVVATQNPIEEEGTYDLPAAQLDRFMLQVRVDFPDTDTELGILNIVQRERQQGGRRAPVTQGLAQISIDDLSEARNAVLNLHLSEPIKQYIVRLVSATRRHHHNGDGDAKNDPYADLTTHIAHPASPRATLALAQLAQARAWLQGRDHVVPDDVQTLASDVLRHRLNLNFRAQAEGVTTHELVREFVERVAVV